METLHQHPHVSRCRIILKAHPEVKRLFGIDPKTKYIAIVLVLVQIILAYSLSRMPFWFVLVMAYTVGGMINHAMNVLIHDAGHNLVFKGSCQNRWIAIFMNLPLGIPSAISFRRYHHKHHRHLGVYPEDPDVPTPFEERYVCGPVSKLLWLLFFPFFYTLRPYIVRPLRPSVWEVINAVVQLVFDALLVYFFGWGALLYLVLSTLLSMSLHPTTGQFITEHYTYKAGQHTFSYYGVFNNLLFNIGYHNEHHDFPMVPWSRLRTLRKLAPEYYDSLYSHTSWIRVLYEFVFDPKYGPHCRMKRHEGANTSLRGAKR